MSSLFLSVGWPEAQQRVTRRLELSRQGYRQDSGQARSKTSGYRVRRYDNKG